MGRRQEREDLQRPSAEFDGVPNKKKKLNNGIKSRFKVTTVLILIT